MKACKVKVVIVSAGPNIRSTFRSFASSVTSKFSSQKKVFSGNTITAWREEGREVNGRAEQKGKGKEEEEGCKDLKRRTMDEMGSSVEGVEREGEERNK